MSKYQFEVVEGENFFSAVTRLKQHLKETGTYSQVLMFKGVAMNVFVDSHIDDVISIYNLKSKLKEYETSI